MDLMRFSHVCDVGGGTGSTLSRMLQAFPHLKGTVFDLSEIQKPAEALLRDAGLSDRVEFVGGDFFDSVPAGCDLYTLFAVIHAWDDNRCLCLLRTIKEAMAPRGRIMVVDKPISPASGYDHAKFADMMMLVYGDGGRERTSSEYTKLYQKAGLTEVRRSMLLSLFTVTELATSDSGIGKS